jgi:acyl-CoA dehydrogenase
MSAIQDGNSYILNGTKVWVSNCGLASWFFVLAKTSPSESTGKAFTGFIVDRDFEGVIISEKEPTMGQKCGYIGSLTLNDVRVPKENIVGPVGKGFSIAMRAFDRVRPLVASLACGIQQRALNESTQYAIQRKTFGTSIINHQSVGSKLAVMAQNLEASKLLILQAADKIDNGDSDSTYLSSIAKCFSSDAALQASINAIQVILKSNLIKF